jgi:hypothetical protein
MEIHWESINIHTDLDENMSTANISEGTQESLRERKLGIRNGFEKGT